MLHVIVPYFNYTGSELRKKNTLDFLDYLDNSYDVKFHFIEASLDDSWLIDNRTQSRYAYIASYYRIRVRSKIWRKENLINIAVESVPDGEAFAWIDSDVKFTDSMWARIILMQLSLYDIVQVFHAADFLKEDRSLDYTSCGIIAYCDPFRDDLRRLPHRIIPAHPGYGWAMRKSVWRNTRLPELSLVGSGDAEFAYGVLGEIDRLKIEKSKAHFACLKGWSANLVDTSVSWCNMIIRHYWHGPVENRRYFSRDSILKDSDYNPMLDLEFVGRDEVIELSDFGQRLAPALNQFFSQYS